ncbi:hypothetical protein CRU99_07705 [Malaciobacter mytili]|uniref:hypothetical protein n=1 Tax=Malaciobacter mytili TaxID=603050 RepID=UPI00100BAC7E|nr:hypothetical protein [Malaciobacter mytili]RXI43410.1 hypothetical protein CRU99_07705 [Malaciobacter mytili]
MTNEHEEKLREKLDEVESFSKFLYEQTENFIHHYQIEKINDSEKIKKIEKKMLTLNINIKNLIQDIKTFEDELKNMKKTIIVEKLGKNELIGKYFNGEFDEIKEEIKNNLEIQLDTKIKKSEEKNQNKNIYIFVFVSLIFLLLFIFIYKG